MNETKQHRLGGYGRTVVWLREHGLNTQQIVDLLDASSVHVRQLEYQGRRLRTSFEMLPPQLLVDRGTWTVPGSDLRKFLGIRAEEDAVELTPRAERKIAMVQAAIDSYAVGFWSGVRYESGITRLRALLPRVGYPAHVWRMRQRARIHELCSETYLHSGSSIAGIEDGLRAYHLYRVAFHESGERCDLEQIGRVARLLSQVFLLRREAELADHYLHLHRAAHQRLGRQPRPEYHRQLAILAFQKGDSDADRVTRIELKLAGDGLAKTIDYGEVRKPHEVRDIEERYLPLLTPLNWEGANDICQSQIRQYPAGDIHVGLNVATAAACGLSIDDSTVQQQAEDLLDQHAETAVGYRRLETTFALLRLTRRLPLRMRRQWARFALFENVQDGRERFPRYAKSGG